MDEKSHTHKKPIFNIPESHQKYLEEIYTISRKKKGGWVSNKEIAERLKVDPSSVSGIFHKLKKENLINWEPRKPIRLTKKGKELAIYLTEAHSLLKVFFGNVLKIKDEIIVETLSCKFEHYFAKDVKKALEEFLTQYLKWNGV